MKRSSKGRNLIVLITAVVISLTMAVYSALSGGVGLFSDIAGTVYLPIQKAVASVSRGVSDFFERIANSEKLQAENRELKQTIEEMEALIRDAQSEKDENARLRELLSFKNKHRDLNCKPASVTAVTLSSWQASFTIDKGTKAGIRPGMCVMTESGVFAGVVSESGSLWSTVDFVTDPNCSVGVRLLRSGETGLAEGDCTLLPDNMLRLSYLGLDSDVSSNDSVLSSGDGSIFPSGLLLGTVYSVQTDISGSSLDVRITPAADILSLSQVFVVTSFSEED